LVFLFKFFCNELLFLWHRRLCHSLQRSEVCSALISGQ
jgi:hypothetical protein